MVSVKAAMTAVTGHCDGRHNAEPLGGLCVLNCFREFYKRGLRVAVEHSTVRFEEKGILDSGKAFALSALEYNYRASLIDFKNRHSGNRAFRIVASIGVYNIVSSDHYCYIGRREFRVDLLEIVERRIRNVRFGQQDIHVSRHSAGHRMNRVFDSYASSFEHRRQLANRVLCLSSCHSVARHKDYLIRVCKLDRYIFSLDLTHLAETAAEGHFNLGPERSEQDIGYRTIHRPAHQH